MTMSSNKFIKFVRFARPTGKSLRASPAVYESRWPSEEIAASGTLTMEAICATCFVYSCQCDRGLSGIRC